MKKLILSELLLLFLATTFISDNPPPGWYQQTLPVNDQINDLFFIDSLNGWVVTDGRTSTNDTAYIMKTTNGGNNWVIEYNQAMKLNAVQFTNTNTGYVVGGSGSGTGRIFKTTNGGTNWININTFSTLFEDLFFVNKDTGWACDADALFGVGIIKTTNGGINWTQQLAASFRPQKLFFINSDTGWAGSADWKLYRTTNSGQVWVLQYTTNVPIGSVFFLDGLKGWIQAGGTGNGVAYTTDGGLNWQNGQGNVASGYDVKFVTDSLGYSGGSLQKVAKSTDGGKNWGYQTIPIFSALQTSFFKGDTLLGWMGNNGIIKTNDGGGPITFTGIQQISTEIPTDFKLYQNYPNPFNPATIIRFQIQRLADIKITVYDIRGKEITLLTDKEFIAGTYEVTFDGTVYSSGVYFYSLMVDGKIIDTKRMVLVK